MSTGRIHLVVGDTRPEIYLQLRQPEKLLDLSLARVFLRIKPYGSDVVMILMTGELLPGTLQADLIQADLTQYPTPGSGGRVRFQFNEGDLAIPPGRYLGEVEVNYGPANSFTLFTRLEFLLRVEF